MQLLRPAYAFNFLIFLPRRRFYCTVYQALETGPKLRSMKTCILRKREFGQIRAISEQFVTPLTFTDILGYIRATQIKFCTLTEHEDRKAQLAVHFCGTEDSSSNPKWGHNPTVDVETYRVRTVQRIYL